MPYVYAAALTPYLVFDGTNIQEIVDAFCPQDYTEIIGANRIVVSGTGSGDADVTYEVNDVANGFPGKILAADWLSHYLKL